MAHDEHHTPGEPPPIRDEAADSPLWLPALGLTLLLLGAIFVVWRSATAEEPEPPAAEEIAAAAAEGGDGAAEGEGEAEAPE